VFLKVQDDDGFGIIEIMELKQLFDPFAKTVCARLHGGEELQDQQDYVLDFTVVKNCRTSKTTSKKIFPFLLENLFLVVGMILAIRVFDD